MSAKVAIIIPCFNAADTLPRLLDSLKGQTFRDFTVLFVDDGSTDASAEIIRGKSACDARFVLLRGEHYGPGSARNVGLDEADRLGVPYVTFVDADDVPAPDMLETAVDAIERSNADIVHYQWASEPGGAPHKDSIGKPAIYVWNKLYRRAAIEGIRFVKAKFAEDLAFFLETEARGVRRTAVEKSLYVHVRRPGSLWESRSHDDISDAVRTVVGHLDPILRGAAPVLKRQWIGVYLPGLLKTWKKSLRKVLREKRGPETDAYLKFVSGVRFQGLSAVRFRVSHAIFATKTRIRNMLRRQLEVRRMKRLKHNYDGVLRRLRALPRGQRIRVLFHMTDVSKWKCKSFYDELKASMLFSPGVLTDLTEGEMRLPPNRRRAIYDERRRYFADRGYAVMDGYDVKSGRCVSARSFGFDVFVYQQPWGMMSDRRPMCMSCRALCLYVPYYVVSPGDLELDCAQPFHRMMHTVFVPNAEFAALYGCVCGDLPRTCKFVGSGNPMMDEFAMATPQNGAEWVIYAPHWTFSHPNHRTVLKIGTFSENGRAILAYAERHSEFNWVFKPHPCLRGSLISSGAMTPSEVDAYYEAWGRIGRVCLDADYPTLFNESRAMITDCGSFIAEYGATGKPLIYLVSRENQLKPPAPFRPLWNVLYSVRSDDEMWRAFSEILERGEDPQRAVRVDVVRRLRLADGGAGKRMSKYLEQIIFEDGSSKETGKGSSHD